MAALELKKIFLGTIFKTVVIS